jgi:hypothetical protein
MTGEATSGPDHTTTRARADLDRLARDIATPRPWATPAERCSCRQPILLLPGEDVDQAEPRLGCAFTTERSWVEHLEEQRHCWRRSPRNASR